MAAIVAPATSNLLASANSNPVVPINSLTEVCTGDASLCGAPPAPNAAASVQQGPDGTLVFVPTGPTTTVDPTLTTFNGPFTFTQVTPLQVFNGATVILADGADLFQVGPAGVVSLAGPLASLTNSGLFIPSGSLLDMVGGSLTSTTTLPLFALDPSVVFAGDAFV